MSKRQAKTDRDPSVTEAGDGDAFLSRWTRRKRVARSGADPDAAQPETSDDAESLARAAPAAGDEPPASGEGDAPELTDEDMPPVDSIDEDTDMSGFFSPKVSQAVKKAALRKFFHSPAFNIVDGLDDYDDDFTSFPALGDIITSDMRGQMEREAERARESMAKADEVVEPAPPEEAAGEHVDGSGAPPHESTDARAEGSAPPRSDEASPDEPAVTRDPARHAEAGPGKLRPRGADEDA
jgi:hypothetical protein